MATQKEQIDRELYARKSTWLDNVMASRLSPATKIFAYSIHKRAYGVKTQSYPDASLIMEDTNFKSHGHFKTYREALVHCGALEVDLGYHTRNARHRNYLYTLRLDWDGTVPSADGP
jgi:hypothetical protein